MGDHFVLLVDRLLTESTLEAAIQNKNKLQHAEHMTISLPFDRMNFDIELSPRKLAECRICHDEDDDSKMEIPCSCRGSLKYAHRKCIQRWCNEKGDTICEICRQPFKPGYTAPPPLFRNGGIPMNFRGNWRISRSDLNSQITRIVSTDEDFVDPDFDEYPVLTSGSMIGCRIAAVIFMVLLVLRHTLPFMYSSGEYSISLFMLLILRTIGVVLPVYIMAKALTAIQKRRIRQVSTDIENELPQHQQQSRLI